VISRHVNNHILIIAAYQALKPPRSSVTRR
jgi:hypothetical protein